MVRLYYIYTVISGPVPDSYNDVLNTYSVINFILKIFSKYHFGIIPLFTPSFNKTAKYPIYNCRHCNRSPKTQTRNENYSYP